MGIARDCGRGRHRESPVAHTSFRVRRPVRLLSMTFTLRFGAAWLVLTMAIGGTSTASAQTAASPQTVSAPITASAQTAVSALTTPSQQSTSAPEREGAPCDRYGVSTVVRCIGHDLGGMFHGGSLRTLAIGGALAAGTHLAD